MIVKIGYRYFAGDRHSDHVALLNVFQQWEFARDSGNDQMFCDANMVASAAMRMTSEAKHQLITLLTQCGFHEDILAPASYKVKGIDERLDVFTALLCLGLYPNICYHMSKRKVLTTGNKLALLHKSSVTCRRFEDNPFPSPFFIFSEKIRTRAVACKQLTMVTPLHLLLFGARRVELVAGVVRLDGWINLAMDPVAAASLVALRPALDSLIVRASNNPEEVSEPSELDGMVVDVIKELCSPFAGRNGMEELPQPSSFRQFPPRPLFPGYQGRFQGRGGFRGRGWGRGGPRF